MGIEIIGKLTQKNNGDFKLVDLADVDYDGTGKSAKQELEKKIEEAKNSSTPYDDTKIKTDINTIKTDLGTEELTTTAKNVKGAVNEVAAQYKDIENNKADKNSVFTMANMGQDIKEAMTGGSVAVVGVNTVDTINTKNNAIESRNIKGHSIINLLNSEESEIGYMGADGIVDTSQTTYRVSPYIQVNSGDTISFAGRCQQWKVQLVIFDVNFNKIEAKTFSAEGGDVNTWGTLSPFTITNSDCVYIRFNYSKAVEQPFCYLSSTVPSSFIPYNEASLDWLKVKKENLMPNSITLDKLNLNNDNQLFLTDTIKYNTVTSYLYLPNLLYIVNGAYKTVKATDFPDQHPSGEFRFWVHDLSTLYFDSEEANKGNYPFIFKRLSQTVEQSGSRYQTIAVVKDKGIISNYTVEYIGNNVTLMIPNKLFLVEDEILPIYKNSIINNIEEGRKVTMMFKSDKSYSDGYYEYIEPKININPAKVGTDGFIGIIPSTLNWEDGFYGKKIAINIKKKTEITNKTPNLLFFGDSLTAKGTPSKTKDFLTNWGLSANMLGTVKDDYNVPCEGRGSRTFAQYIGYRSLETTDDTTSTPIYPFLKVATSEDKANHPTWCFTRTGSVKEQNYTEATDKSQDFYIFDFSHYLTSQGYSNPDVVIISMSTNDFWKYSESEATSICKLAYEIMINQILTACPDCKIGIIPNPAYASTKGDKEKVSKWNTVAQDYICGMNKSNVDIIGAWLSQSSDMSFNLAKNVEVAKGGINSYRQPDTIHPTPWGIKEASKSIACYIVNQL